MVKSPYTLADKSNFTHQIWQRMGLPPMSTLPPLDFFWAPATKRQKIQIIVTLMGKHGPVGISEDEDVFPSDELITKIRLLLS